MLREIAIKNGYTDSKLLEVLDLISDDLTISLVADALMDGHLCEYTALNRIKALGVNPPGISPADARRKVLSLNEWDCYYLIALLESVGFTI